MAFDGCCPDCKLPGDGCPLSKFYFFSYLFLFVVSFGSCELKSPFDACVNSTIFLQVHVVLIRLKAYSVFSLLSVIL